MNSVKIFQIFGVFFQEHSSLGLAIGENGEGAIAVITSILGRFAYNGILAGENYCSLEGTMEDIFGESLIKDVIMDNENLRFEKWYRDRNYPIKYSFKRKGDIWVGTFDSLPTGSGSTNCILTELSKNFFESQS